MTKLTSAFLLLAVCFSLPPLGCGGSDSCQIAGEISFEGRPVTIGMISFEPQTANSQIGSAAIREGRYEIAGEVNLKPGAYLVRITAPDPEKSGSSANLGPNDPPPRIVPLLPPSWNVRSSLSVELQPGKNTVNFNGGKTDLPKAEIGK